MGRQSGYKNKLERQYEKKIYQAHLFAAQYTLDAAIMACNEVFGAGPERAKKFCDAYGRYLDALSALVNADSKDTEYSRTKIDEKLKSICGEYFQDWDARYGYIYGQGNKPEATKSGREDRRKNDR